MSEHLAFTHVNLVALALAYRRVRALRGPCVAWSVGIAASFYAARALDATSFARIARKHQLTPRAFHTLNAAAHLAPLVLAYKWRRYATCRCAILAAAVHLLWGAAVSRGTMCLDRVYVPMRRSDWTVLWTVCVLAETLPFLGTRPLVPKRLA